MGRFGTALMWVKGIANYKFLSEGKFDRTIQVSFVISFLMFYNLTQDDENIQDFGSPVVKINYQWIAKSINIDKNEIIQMLNYLFDELQDVPDKYHTAPHHEEIARNWLGCVWGDQDRLERTFDRHTGQKENSYETSQYGETVRQSFAPTSASQEYCQSTDLDTGTNLPHIGW